VPVVNDLVAHVDGAVEIESSRDRLNGALDARTVTTRRGENYALNHSTITRPS